MAYVLRCFRFLSVCGGEYLDFIYIYIYIYVYIHIYVYIYIYIQLFFKGHKLNLKAKSQTPSVKNEAMVSNALFRIEVAWNSAHDDTRGPTYIRKLYVDSRTIVYMFSN